MISTKIVTFLIFTFILFDYNYIMYKNLDLTKRYYIMMTGHLKFTKYNKFNTKIIIINEIINIKKIILFYNSNNYLFYTISINTIIFKSL